jgi:hypothetical protein
MVGFLLGGVVRLIVAQRWVGSQPRFQGMTVIIDKVVAEFVRQRESNAGMIPRAGRVTVDMKTTRPVFDHAIKCSTVRTVAQCDSLSIDDGHWVNRSIRERLFGDARSKFADLS